MGTFQTKQKSRIILVYLCRAERGGEEVQLQILFMFANMLQDLIGKVYDLLVGVLIAWQIRL